MAYYAVKVGKVPGIYLSWDECSKMVNGFKGAKFHKFDTIEQAEEWMGQELYQSNHYNEENGTIHYPCAFVDGSYNPKTKVCGYGVAFLLNENSKPEPINGIDKGDPELRLMRNVYGELMGCIEAVKKAFNMHLNEINIYYDYNGIELWANGQWNTSKPFVKRYINFINGIRKSMDVNFYKVAAHTGVEWNEMADQLAKEAVGV